MTLTGADRVFSMLPAASAGVSRAFASGVDRNTKRAGQEFALVGPSLARSLDLLQYLRRHGFGEPRGIHTSGAEKLVERLVRSWSIVLRNLLFASSILQG